MKAVAYYRVSTAAQGRSGLGLEAQRAAVHAYCQQRGATLLGEHTEIESGALAERTELAAAVKLAHLTGATLLIAKLDRLSRNAAFLLTLRDSGTDFIAVDMPFANTVTVGIFAVIAEEERRAISERTKAALGAAKARGVKLGNPNGAAALRRAGKGTVAALDAVRDNARRRSEALADTLADIRAGGATSLTAVARSLNERQIRTPRGGQWHATSVRRLVARLAV